LHFFFSFLLIPGSWSLGESEGLDETSLSFTLGLILAALGASCDGCPAPPAALLDLVGLVAPEFYSADNYTIQPSLPLFRGRAALVFSI